MLLLRLKGKADALTFEIFKPRNVTKCRCERGKRRSNYASLRFLGVEQCSAKLPFQDCEDVSVTGKFRTKC